MPVVLIAEDDEDIALILTRLLKRAGYTVMHAPDGERAFELAVANRPDVLLTDLGMPRMDGLELTRAIREHADLRDTPIIMLSGHLHPGDGEPVTAGVCVVLLKPCPNDKLREVVNELAELGPHGHQGADSACPARWPVSA
ncbi:response regulator [Actinoplanes sp. LDG1-06]|uniref:Response regulator n=1 Tax=Paractinoplanes ovalisporus TaxID=2810368 RepID=A0ABS2ANA2_9ACTN|nr:response regulator [Actinoplanes ovalisporus]MBM2621342.1 response regulator [Actinoplanes ovalisporus]